MGRSSLRSRRHASLLAAAGFAFCSAVQADTLSAAGDATGESGGQFTGLAQSASANLYSGTFSLSVPIETPPGRAAATPELKVSYSSAGGDGPFGLGWSWPGGSIERNTKNGVPRCTGAGAADFAVNLPSGTAELVLSSGNTYLAKTDEGYLVAVADPTNNLWSVVDRSGRTYLFGTTSSARIFRSVDTFNNGNAGCQLTSSWALTQVRDPNGNTIDYTYEKDQGALYPSSIEYGGNAVVGSAHAFRVEFATAARTALSLNSSISFRRGARESLEKVITQVKTRFRTSSGGSWSDIRTYSFSYANCGAASRPLLCAVSASAGAGAALRTLPTQTFEYATSQLAHGGTGYEMSGTVSKPIRDTDASSSDVAHTVMDIDGDGYLDLVDAAEGTANWKVYYGSQSGFAATATTLTIPSGPPVSGMGTRVEYTAQNACCGGSLDTTNRSTFDLTGDGIPDYVDAQAGDWKAFAGQCTADGVCTFSSSYQAISTGGVTTPIRYDFNTPTYAFGYRRAMDITGDGRPDAVHGESGFYGPGPGDPPTDPSGYAGEFTVLSNSGTGFTSDVSFSSWYKHYLQHSEKQIGGTTDGWWRDYVAFFDWNGDGLPDLVTNYQRNPSPPPNDERGVYAARTTTIRVYLNNGFGFETTSLDLATGWVGEADDNRLGRADFVDINADGLPDRVTWSGSGAIQVSLNNGVFLGAPQSWAGITSAIRKNTKKANTTVDLIDMNGDGFVDWVDARNYPWLIKLGHPATGPAAPPNVMLRAHTGLGGMTEVRYEPSNRVDNSGPSDTIQRLPGVLWIVTGLRSTDGLCTTSAADPFDPAQNSCITTGHELARRIGYEGGLFDPTSREFRGFRLVKETFGDGSSRQTTFSQADHTRGKTLMVQSLAETGSPTEVKRETYTWATQSSLGRTQVYLQTKRTELFALSGGTTSQCVVQRNEAPDAFGRVLTSCSQPCSGATSSCSSSTVDQVTNIATWADPVSGSAVRDRPSYTRVSYYPAVGQQVYQSEKWFQYDGSPGSPLGAGQVGAGNLSYVRSYLNGTSDPVVRTEFDGYGNVKKITDPLGRADTFDFSSSPFSLYWTTHTLPQTGTVSHVESQAFDISLGKRTQATGENTGEVYGWTYDSLGRLVCEAKPGNSCTGTATRIYSYQYGTPGAGTLEAKLSLAEATDLGGTAKAYFDALGRRVAVTKDRIVGAATSAVTVVAEQTGYDSGGRVAKKYVPYQAPIQLTPTSGGQPVASIQYAYALNALGVSDPLGRPRSVTTPDGHAPTYTYDGNRSTETDPLGNDTVVFRDGYGREKDKLLYDGAALRMRFATTYDGESRVLTSTVYGNPGGQSAPSTITYTYDRLGRRSQMTDPDSGATSAAGTFTYGYDIAGNLIYQDDPKTSPSAQHVELCYDALDRLTRRVTFTNDAFSGGNYSLVCTVAKSQLATYSAAEESAYTYDQLDSGNAGRGRLTYVADKTGWEALYYDARGRLLETAKWISGKGAATDFTYDDLDRLDEVIYPDGEIVAYAYRSDGALQAVTSSTGTTFVSDIDYDLFGRMVKLVHGNGVEDQFTFHGALENFQLQNLKTVRVQNGSVTATYLNLDHLYTARGQLESITDLRDASGSLSNGAGYLYDGLGRLTSVSGSAYSDSFAYNELGNVTTKGGQTFVYSASKHHQLTSAGAFAASASYDGNGNRLTKTLSGGSGSETYVYDALDQITQIQVSSGVTADYAYDWRGERVKKTVGGVVKYRYFNEWFESHEGYKTKYVLVNGKILATADAQDATYGSVLFGADEALLPDGAAVAVIGGLLALLLLAPGRRRQRVGVMVSRARAASVATLVLAGTSPMLLAVQCGGGTVTITHNHLDRLGSTQALTSVSGTLAGQARYKAYGETRHRADGAGTPVSGTDLRRHEFTGHEAELASGLIYAGARYYDPELGQFLSLDPVTQFASPYAYGPWDPMSGTDPQGEDWMFVVWVIVVAITAYNTLKAWANYLNSGAGWKAAADWYKSYAIGAAKAYLAQGILRAVSGSVYGAAPADPVSGTSSRSLGWLDQWGDQADNEETPTQMAGGGAIIIIGGIAYNIDSIEELKSLGRTGDKGKELLQKIKDGRVIDSEDGSQVKPTTQQRQRAKTAQKGVGTRLQRVGGPRIKPSGRFRVGGGWFILLDAILTAFPAPETPEEAAQRCYRDPNCA